VRDEIGKWRNLLLARLNSNIAVDERDSVKAPKTLALVAILRHEDEFVDEWVAYHRLLGVDHFYLYDHDPRLPLRKLMHKHRGYVTVTDWLVRHDDTRHRGYSAQIKAYNHYLRHYSGRDEWAAFIDIDEFLALRKHGNLKDFLRERDYSCAVSLNCFNFGHNGHYRNPQGLIVESLTRRARDANRHLKTINKNKCVKDIVNPHYAILGADCQRVDGNGRPLGTPLETDDRHAFNAHYEGIGDVACIHHYHCRSFENWMRRPKRGSVDGMTSAAYWQTREQSCLDRFVTIVAKHENECEDLTLASYAPAIRRHLNGLVVPETRAIDELGS